MPAAIASRTTLPKASDSDSKTNTAAPLMSAAANSVCATRGWKHARVAKPRLLGRCWSSVMYFSSSPADDHQANMRKFVRQQGVRLDQIMNTF
jgi:hypothetical protein